MVVWVVIPSGSVSSMLADPDVAEEPFRYVALKRNSMVWDLSTEPLFNQIPLIVAFVGVTVNICESVGVFGGVLAPDIVSR